MVLYRAILASALCLSTGVAAFAQTAKSTAALHKTTGTSQPMTSTASLKTTTDSLSYAIGLSVANFYKQYNITNINTALVTRAINDVNKKGKMLMDDQQAQACVTNYVMKSKSEKAAGAKKQGQ